MGTDKTLHWPMRWKLIPLIEDYAEQRPGCKDKDLVNTIIINVHRGLNVQFYNSSLPDLEHSKIVTITITVLFYKYGNWNREVKLNKGQWKFEHRS